MPAPAASGWSDLAGWALHPLESAAFSRRTPISAVGQRQSPLIPPVEAGSFDHIPCSPRDREAEHEAARSVDLNRQCYACLAALGPWAATRQDAADRRARGWDENNAEQQARHAAFRQLLQQAGWTIGDRLKIDYRWGVAEGDRIRRYALELATLAPDVILTTDGAGAEAMLRATRTTPIVFVIVPDPVGSGLVDSLSRPGGYATGFMMFEYNLCTNGRNC